MKQGQIVAVYNILNRFSNDINLPNDISYTFFRILKRIQDNIDFQIKRQKEIDEKYPRHVDENGTLVFESPDDGDKFVREINELSDMDADIGEFEKIPFKADGRCNLSPRELMLLEDFLEYV